MIYWFLLGLALGIANGAAMLALWYRWQALADRDAARDDDEFAASMAEWGYIGLRRGGSK